MLFPSCRTQPLNRNDQRRMYPLNFNYREPLRVMALITQENHLAGYFQFRCYPHQRFSLVRTNHIPQPENIPMPSLN